MLLPAVGNLALGLICHCVCMLIARNEWKPRDQKQFYGWRRGRTVRRLDGRCTPYIKLSSLTVALCAIYSAVCGTPHCRCAGWLVRVIDRDRQSCRAYVRIVEHWGDCVTQHTYRLFGPCKQYIVLSRSSTSNRNIFSHLETRFFSQPCQVCLLYTINNVLRAHLDQCDPVSWALCLSVTSPFNRLLNRHWVCAHCQPLMTVQEARGPTTLPDS